MTGQAIDLRTDLIQFYFFEQALDEVIESMRKEKVQ